jgi:2-C-methyl-D-erythritol 4-phosphate cytidylyltransferase
MLAGMNKQWLELAGQPILAHSVRIFQQSAWIAEIALVGADRELERIQELVREQGFSKVKAIVSGGDERQESVYHGLSALSDDISRVVVHDGARPLLTPEGLESFLRAAEGCQAAFMAIPLKDTVKRIDADGWVVETPRRDQLRAVQTPQIFQRNLLERAHARAAEAGWIGTDDAELLESLGVPVKVLPGEMTNIKITTPEDVFLMEYILNQRYNKG